MGRRPKSDPLVDVTVGGVRARIATSTVDRLPEALLFAEYLLTEQRCSIPTALRYVRLVADAKHAGRLDDPKRVARQPDLTAVMAYWRWIEVAYEKRVQDVVRALPELRGSVGHLRVGSLVAPVQGKLIPPRGSAFAPSLGMGGAARPVPWIPSSRWTLHVPPVPPGDATPWGNGRPLTPPHTDPCSTCAAIELTDEQLAVVARTFYAAWGNRTPESLPPESFLFGQPPIAGIYAPAHTAVPLGKVLALVERGPIADNVEQQLRGATTVDVDAFIAGIRDRNPDTVVISRALAGPRWHEIINALAAARDKESEAAPAPPGPLLS